jgi:iron-sulfur cluster repair protein YtfE (RIC family)
MATSIQPLRDEHKELLPPIEELRIVGDEVGEVSPEALRQSVDKVYEFLTHYLIPHAYAEDQALYPLVGKVMGAVEATATMSRDHVEVSQLIEELASLRAQLAGTILRAAQAKALRRVLYGLYTLVKVHFAKEEEVYLPLLEARLSPEEAHRMFEAMEAAVKEVRGHPVH